MTEEEEKEEKEKAGMIRQVAGMRKAAAIA